MCIELNFMFLFFKSLYIDNTIGVHARRGGGWSSYPEHLGDPSQEISLVGEKWILLLLQWKLQSCLGCRSVLR